MIHKKLRLFRLTCSNFDINYYYDGMNTINNLCANTLGIEPIQIFKPIKGLKFRKAKKKYNYIKNKATLFQNATSEISDLHTLAKPNQKLSYCRHTGDALGLSTVNKIIMGTNRPYTI